MGRLLLAIVLAGILTVSDADATAPSARNGLLAFNIDYGYGGGIAIASSTASGKDFRRLTHNRASNEDPAWSPDGTKIAFSRSVSGARDEIYLMSATGTRL
jgi:Tol biopolymer transport system component